MALSEITDVATILRQWEEEHSQPMFDPMPMLTRLAEIIEVEADNYLKMDPDPFDERHPSRADPECQLGQVLKILFKKDNFMTKLVNDYLRENYYSRQGDLTKDVTKLNVAACRLMLDIMPGLETSAVFQVESDPLIQRAIKWATHSSEPLQSYATGLLAAAMEVSEIATQFRDQNAKLVQLMLQRLRRLQSKSKKKEGPDRPFAHLTSKEPNQETYIAPPQATSARKENGMMSPTLRSPMLSPDRSDTEMPSPDKPAMHSDSENESSRKRLKVDTASLHNQTPPGHRNCSYAMSDTSNSSWAELENYVIGSVQIYPPTLSTRQMLILRYLTPMGEYQEFLSHVFENNALELILNFVNVRETKDSRLAFEALKYLASLLCHKKFSIEFIQVGGLQKLLEVPRPSVAATGVSMSLYYLAYCEDAMERVCQLPRCVVKDLVKYALWLLECSHASGRCHATMFFGLTFQFRVILEEFDEHDGLRKLYNVVSTLPIISMEDDAAMMNDDAECAARQIVRHVCSALKRYLEAHLYYKVQELQRSHLPIYPDRCASPVHQYSFKAWTCRPEEVQEQIETLFQLMPFRAHWAPVDQLLKLSGITLLLQIIAFAYEWNYSGRAETVRSALDVLAICSVMPRVQLVLCDRVDLPEDAMTVGMNIILGAAEGEIVADPDVQRAALNVICNCVSAPIHRVGGVAAKFTSSTNSPSKKTKVRSSEELIQKMWDSVRSNTGIMVLLQLMQVKTPITDADSTRALACKALAGLARSDTVKQIVGKLPLFTSGQLQILIRNPILQEKRQEHYLFQKYALELMERLSGRTKPAGSDADVSLVNIHRANVVAQTKILFNDKQLLQLIHQHLISRNLTDTALALQKEANLASMVCSTSSSHNLPPPTPIRYTTPSVPNRTRLSVHTPNSASYLHRPTQSAGKADAQTLNSSSNNGIISNANGSLTPTIKFTRKSTSNTPQASTPTNSRLQKQISRDPKQGIASAASSMDESSSQEGRVTLDSIITEYLMNQHALCKNPMATCPQFNLSIPHKCPDPKPRVTSSANFTVRNARRALGYQTKSLDRRLIHSRFCPVQPIRYSNEGFFTCARFMLPDYYVITGDNCGQVTLYNAQTGVEESTYQCHSSFLVHLEPSRDGSLLLTSCTWGNPLSALWGNAELKLAFDSDEHVEFSKLTQDRVIGTRAERATIYDVATGRKLSTLVPTNSNLYTKNKATFSPTDELVLSDGVLWDVTSNQQIHKLDKLNQTQSGVFHPNGLEIVSNTEVWDLRTFHLLKTVPALNQSQAIFAPVNNAIYAISLEQEMDDDTAYDSSFKTLDASDYSSIATIDVKRNIYDLCVNRYDTQIAIVENQGIYDSIQESVVRIYDVGRRRDDEDEQEEDEDDDMDGSEDGSGSSTYTDDTANVADNDNNEDNDDDGDNNEDDDVSNNDEDDGSNAGSRDLSWTDVSEISSNSDDSFMAEVEELFN